MNNKTIKNIPAQDSNVEVTIKKFMGGDRRKIEGRSIITTIDSSGNQTTRLDHGELKASMMEYGIESATFLPNPCSREQKIAILDNLPSQSYYYIWEQINMFNDFNPEKAAAIKKTSDSS